MGSFGGIWNILEFVGTMVYSVHVAQLYTALGGWGRVFWGGVRLQEN